MKNIWAVISILSLVGAVAAGVLTFAGAITNEQYKTGFLAFSLIWFVAAWFWLGGRKSELETLEEADEKNIVV